MNFFSDDSKFGIRNSKSFTLIELLVVVAIIAVLISILLPALGKARENARQAVCLSNFRQIAVAIYQYAQDYSDFTPPGFTAATAKAWRSPNNYPMQIWDGTGYIQLALLYTDNKRYGTYLKDFAVFHCPSNPTTFAVTPASPSWVPGGKYSEYPYRLAMTNSSTSSLEIPPHLGVAPPGTAMVSDLWADNTMLTVYYGGSVPFHRDRYNVAYIDGSAKAYIDQAQTLRMYGDTPYYLYQTCWAILDKAY